MPTKKSFFGRLFKWLLISGFLCVIVALFAVAFLYYRISPDLPSVEALRSVQLQMPLRVYTADGDLISEFGEKRREPVSIDQVPESLKNAIIAAEDQHFYSHPGVAWQGLVRAFVHLVKTGEKGPGGSTITMQVARNFFLTNEKTYSRKINEIFLSLRIETELSKDEILELYINKIYLGNRAYGFAAAARVYYGKDIGDIDVVESAMLAGLPKAPSRYNPIINPERALLRRNYVLGRMAAEDMIDGPALQQAKEKPVSATLHFSKPDAEANYVGEMARARVKQLFGDAWSTAGYSVYTSIKSEAQKSANKALRRALVEYEKRHGFRGPIGTLDFDLIEDPERLQSALKEFPRHGELIPAVVVSVTDADAVVRLGDGNHFGLTLESLEWARRREGVDTRGPEITSVTEVLTNGDVVHLAIDIDGQPQLAQLPEIEGAFVAVTPATGEITALVGGFDFSRSKFNRVTQARRQPGSTFKPFIYSAALEKGDTAATIYNDAPVVFHDDALEGEWRPQNYSGRFFGPTRLREALVKSRNLVSIRVLREIGIPYAIEYAQRFGFEERNLPPDLSLALGSAGTTPLEIAAAFSVFANDGYRIEPYFITRIEDPNGNLVYAAPSVNLCDECDATLISPLKGEVLANENISADQILQVSESMVDAPRVIERENAYIMQSMMRDVVTRGTARKAGEALGRNDLGGKTGTTNNQLDAWFTGFSRGTVATAWVGSDGLEPLGRREAGGIAALPMWVDFMQEALVNAPEELPSQPENIVKIKIDRKSGEPAIDGDNAVVELFRKEHAPRVVAASTSGGTSGGTAKKQTKRAKKAQEKKLKELF